MKKNWLIMSFTLGIIAIIMCPYMAIGEPADNSLLTGEVITDPTNESANVPGSESPSNSGNQEQSSQNRNLSESYNNQISPHETPRHQTGSITRNATEISETATDSDTSTENIILNTLPEKTTSEEPDTLTKIINWWSVNPLEMKFWYLFLFLSALFFLFKQSTFRKPFLFVSLVAFGFYFNNSVNPINSIFSIPVLTGGKLISSIVLVALPIILSLLFGRFFCGWACPIGAVQEFLHPEKFAFHLPSLLDRILSYLRLILLIGGIILSWSALTNIWNSIDPFQGFFTFKWSLPIVISLVIVIGASIFIERFFCRYLCPLGAILDITSKLSIFKLRADSDLCIACGKCSQPKACPMEVVSTINPYTDLPRIKASGCIVCFRCADLCRYSALKLSFSKLKKNKKIPNQNSGQDLTL